MKQIRSQIEKNRSGFVTLKAENDEDMWHAYNLVTVVRRSSPLDHELDLALSSN
jgi:hypothetical protein